MNVDHSNDADIAEWRRLRRLRTQLEPVAYLFERVNIECKGNCENPKTIYVHEPTGARITCCNIMPTWERYHETRRLERMVGNKVNTGKKAFEPAKSRRVESPLKDAFPRTHSSTYVGMKLKQIQSQEPSEDPNDQTQRLPTVKPQGKHKGH